MPALSQTFTYTVNTNTVTSLIYPSEGQISLLSYTSHPLKGDGYYGSSDGLHTVQIKTTNFIGKIVVQATLEVTPTETDWFDVNLESDTNIVDTTGSSTKKIQIELVYTQPTTLFKIYNFEGNFVHVRVKVSNFAQGILNEIRYNH